jgi:DNA-binding CsgD family transcriptional regulator
MEARTAPGRPTELLERDRELSAIERSLSAAVDGSGGVVLIEGAAGSGKSALIGAARERAASVGLRVHGATSSELEREFAFGCIRQLFESTLRAASPSQRRDLLAGAAAPAERILAPEAMADRTVERFAALNAIYWLVANLAVTSPLLLVVDDLHWADDASIHALGFLARRIGELPVALVLALRPQEPVASAMLIDDLRAVPGLEHVSPPPLSKEAVAAIVRAEEPEASAEACAACHTASAGNPLYLRELLRTLHLTETEPAFHSPDPAARVAQASVPTLADRVTHRVAKVGPDATRLATAMAVLGDGGALSDAARLAGVDPEPAAVVARRLHQMEVLGGEDPFAFVHPLVRRSIYDQLSLAERDAAHADAAALLRERGAPTQAVGAHLAALRPSGSEQVASGLLAAARTALARGAPESAIRLLRRTLDEGAPAPPKAEILLELSRAEMMVRDPAAADHLREAIDEASDPSLRVTATIALADALSAAGRWDELRQLVEEDALRGLGDEQVELVTAFEAMQLAMIAHDPLLMDRFEPTIVRVRELSEASGWAAHALSAVIAGTTASRGADSAETVALAERALRDPVLLGDIDSGGWATAQAFIALGCAERYGRLCEVADEVEREGRRVGSMRALTGGPGYRALAADRRGDLRTAEAEIRPVIDLLLQADVPMWVATLVFMISDTLLERPGNGDVVELLEVAPIDPVFLTTGGGALLRHVRGRLRRERGEAEAGLEDLRAAAETLEALGFAPNMLNWRSELALALPPEEREEAVRLTSEELDLARLIDLPRPLGIALRATGQLTGGAEGIESLRGSVTVLDGSEARLEQARSRLFLGSALREAGQPGEAREHLRTALDLANRCGAERLLERARDELHAAGGRPRRLARTGADALTASELRVSRLAAAGRTNVEIAQDLFVTVKTVETHLSHAYAKLDLSGRGARAGLRAALDVESAPVFSG